MIKSLIFTFTCILSAAAFAAAPDFSIVDHTDEESVAQCRPGQKSFHECVANAWQAAVPTEEQNQKAEEQLKLLQTVYSQHKDAIQSAKNDLKAAWMAQPISKDQVMKARQHLSDELRPVSEATINGHIEVLNLLSVEQRNNFNASFISCINPGTPTVTERP